ncbi:MAG: sigma-70 family RNA polymerase sigma factor [Candidatus Dojkabacteria bacterium]|nr:sigma-70 family RNA polymerase sigma factor [Candidatus Dojkabacteria bacterium]
MIETIERTQETDELSKEFNSIVDRFNKESNKEIPYVPVTEDANPVPQFMADIGRYTPLNQNEIVVLSIIKDKANESSLECIRGNGNLSSERKQELIKDIQDGITAKEILTTLNLPFVVSTAKSFIGRLPLEDLISAGSIGLRRCVDKYDYKLGFKFLTYAKWWIIQSIGRVIAHDINTIRLPDGMYTSLRRYKKVKGNFKQKNGREPSEEELCIELGITPTDLQNIKMADIKYLSMDFEEDNDDDDVHLEEKLTNNEESVEIQVEKKELKKYTRELVQILSPGEQKIVNLRFGLEDGEPKTLQEIGDIIGRTREAVRQRLDKIIPKLKDGTDKLI